jgi:hypothetical protein
MSRTEIGGHAPRVAGRRWPEIAIAARNAGEPVNATLVNRIAGDFNGNGVVDTADYVVWRDGLGRVYTQSDYHVWRANFGQTAHSGSGAGGNGSVPEPATAVLAVIGLALLIPAARQVGTREFGAS